MNPNARYTLEEVSKIQLLEHQLGQLRLWLAVLAGLVVAMGVGVAYLAWRARQRDRALIANVGATIRASLDRYFAEDHAALVAYSAVMHETMHALDLEAAVVARRIGEHLAEVGGRVDAMSQRVDGAMCD